MKEDKPLPSALWHGLGLFGESYILFSVGTLRPLWETLYPTCFDEYDSSECRFPYLSYQSITYSVVLGVMAGMIVLGSLANTIGRRKGSILTALLMSVGAMCLTLSSIFLSSVPSILFPIMSLSLFIFGIGVGGEYPLSASSASERAMVAMKKRQLLELDHSQKMKRLLQSSEDEKTNPTPQQQCDNKNNLSSDGKKKSLLRVDTNTTNNGTTTNPSWQTKNQLSPVVEESYGDVPLSPTNITKETNDSLDTYNSSLRTRGREVLLVFSMQGVGIFANSLMLSFFLVVTRKRNNDNDDDDADEANSNAYYYEPSTLLNIWRMTYATGAAVLIYVLVSRISYLTESEVWAQDKEQREEERREQNQRESGVGYKAAQVMSEGPYEKRMKKAEAERQQQQQEPVISPTMSSITMKSEFDLLGSTNLDGCKLVPEIMERDDDDDEDDSNGHKTMWNPIFSSEMMLLFRHYGVRLFGTSVTWLLWDIAYYGNKLFQSSFLIALTGEDATLVDITCASAINSFVALLGYYAAAAIVDDPDCGRVALQQTGFVITGTLFLLCGLLSDRLSSTALILMYFGSSFFGQCGPNCTTFLIPAEVFPTNMRAMCHGISASAGKLGALLAAILFNFVDERDLFLISGYASFAASLITFLTIPETTTLDLYEIDKQWHKIVKNERYEGPATDPKHLSFYERNHTK